MPLLIRVSDEGSSREPRARSASMQMAQGTLP
jgi:hypothetical protein